MLCEDYAEIVDEDDADYSSPTRDFELDRSRVDLVEIIGEGQFGDVYRGIYVSGQDPVPVAVKTCKVDQDASMADKFLEEACKFVGWMRSHDLFDFVFLLIKLRLNSRESLYALII